MSDKFHFPEDTERSFWQTHVEEAGHKIIELHKITHDGLCACTIPNCGAAGKHPIARHWQETSYLSLEEVERAQEDQRYEHGFGVLLSGLLVIDVDARNGGVESLAKLEKELGFNLIERAGFVVKTGSGGGSMHIYFEAPTDVALVTKINRFEGIDFKSSGFVVGAGSRHASGDRYSVLHGEPVEIGPAPAQLIDLLREPRLIRAFVGSVLCDISPEDIAGAAHTIDPDCDYETWIRCGMAIHHATGGSDAGFSVWERWSQRGEKFPGPSQLAKHWGSFGKSANPVTIGTLFQYAFEAGWTMPAHLRPTPIGESRHDGPPIDLTGVDILKPPNFVGEIAAWIDSQCFFPRERLVVAAALVAVGNIVGLRYEDDITGATANLFAFCVAGSSSGKEGVGQAFSKLMAASRLSPAVHGGIKSTQEITRNLIAHQSAYYAIDELGVELAKVISAQKRGGAAYLEGVIGELMKVYSKANGIYLVSGDVKAAVRSDIHSEIKALEKRQRSDHPDPAIERAIEETRSKLASMDLGIERPFLSLIGWTTPSTFSEIMSYEQATAGFLGRALLLYEPENNPKAREGVIPSDVPPDISAALQRMAWGEVSGGRFGRIAERGPRRRIKTEDNAREALRRVRAWTYEELAAHHQETTGLEAVARRSYELIAKISLILGAPSGVRTLEHVRYATALALADLREKTRAVIAHEEQGDRGIAAAVYGSLSDSPVTLGVIVNAHHLRKISRPLIEKALQNLVDTGKAIKGERRDRRSKEKMVPVWSRAGD